MSTVLVDPTDIGNPPGSGPLRAGGQPGSVEVADAEKNLPSTRSKASERQMPALTVCRDLFAGQERMHAKGTEYLPREPGEEATDYANRLARSLFFNAFSHTVEGLAGFVFWRDPKLGDDVPKQIVGHWENIDNAGTHGDVFARELLQDALIAGHAAILVDHPQIEAGATRADELRIGARPYWVGIRKEDILSWRTEVIDGQRVLAQVVIRERTMEPDGDFGEKEVTRYRVLYRAGGIAGWRLLAVTEQRTVITEGEGVFGNQVEIPIAEVATSGKTGLFESDPPLIDLAWINVAHYQQWSDYANSIHKTNVPIFVTAGLPTTDQQGNRVTLTLGANTALMIPDPQGTAKYVSHDGASLTSSKAALDDLKSDMATLGVSMLASQKRVAETAEAKRIDKSAADSALGVTARALQDAIERALGFHARYMKLESGGSIAINRDFDNLLMEPDVMQAYVAAARFAGFPVRQLLEMWQAGGRISEDANLDELEMQMLGMTRAREDAEALDAAREEAA